MFKLTKYIGPGRIGLVEIDGKKVRTPSLAENIDISFLRDIKDLDTSQNSVCVLPDMNFGYTVPAEYVESYLKETVEIKKKDSKKLLGISVPIINDIRATFDFLRKCRNFDLIILKNINELMADSKNAALFLINLRNNLAENQLVYTPGVVTPSLASFLAYFGVDFFDTSFAKMAAESGLMALSNMYVAKDDQNSDDMYQKSYERFVQSLDEFKLHAVNTTTYDYIESSAYTDPMMYSVLKRIYVHYFEDIEKYASVTGRKSVFTDISFNRPQVAKFIEKVTKLRYLDTDCVLLLPCTAKKPYSSSKTMRAIQRQVKNFHNVQKFVLTSPLGVVPYQLERVYPANSYDIPVTGIWSHEEKKRVLDILNTLLSQYKSKKIICHVTGPYLELCKELKGHELVFTAEDGLTSPKSLEMLNRELSDVRKTKTFIDDLGVLISYQFGPESLSFFDQTKVFGKNTKRIINENNTVIATIDPKRGLLSLTHDGANRLSKIINRFDIQIDFDLKTNTVFAVGVDDASDDIRIGDEVIIKQKDQVIGVGVAEMPGDIMKKSETGIAVRVRHRK